MISIQGQRFGVELEYVRISREQAAKAVQSVVGGTVRHIGSPACFDPWECRDEKGRVWRVVADSSLCDTPRNKQAEVVTPILTYGDIPELQDVVRALFNAGAKISRQTGLHVHVDAKPHTAQSLSNLVKLVNAHQRHIVEALEVRPERRSRYARDIDERLVEEICRRRPRELRQLNRAWYGSYTESPGRYESSRYHGLNLNSVWHRGTVEFRYFNGTSHAGRVKAYIQFCLALSARALNVRHSIAYPRSYDPATTRYDFRVFLLRLGLIGPEFKTARFHLLKNLNGSAAWRRAA